MTSSAIAELERPSRVACSDLLAQLSFVLYIIKCIKLLPTFRWCLLNRVRLQIRGLNSPLDTTILADADALGPKRLRVNPHTSVRFLLHYRVGDGHCHVSIFAGNASHSQGDGICAHWVVSRFGLTTQAQARGTNNVAREGGTREAIPRWLQRFVRRRGVHLLESFRSSSPASALASKSKCSALAHSNRIGEQRAEIQKPRYRKNPNHQNCRRERSRTNTKRFDV